jgi:hypothetical protein
MTGAALTESDLAKRLQRMWALGARIGVVAPRLASQPNDTNAPESGSFRVFWPLREHVCHQQLTGRQKKVRSAIRLAPQTHGVRVDSPESLEMVKPDGSKWQ